MKLPTDKLNLYGNTLIQRKSNESDSPNETPTCLTTEQLSSDKSLLTEISTGATCMLLHLWTIPGRHAVPIATMNIHQFAFPQSYPVGKGPDENPSCLGDLRVDVE